MKSNIKIDISQANQSKLTVPKSDYSLFLEDIKKVKYPTYAISQAENLSDKIATFKNQKVRTKLQQELSSLNSYRKVRGDGNCFFRALAFAYISSISRPNFNNCFQMIDQINLACCHQQSIPKDFQKFYDHKFLYTVLQQFWEQTYQKCLKQSANIQKKALLKLFDENPYLDFIVVLYFRAVCLKALWKYQQQFSDFIAGGEQSAIRTYSEETQGITINLCSKILNITIFVYEVRKQQIHSYHYDASKIKRNVPSIYLLFYENHYDIIQFNENILAEQSGLKKKQTYYGEVVQKLNNGVCAECGLGGYVYDVSGLCIKCHEHSLSSLNNFATEKFVKGKCGQCYKVKDDISTLFGLCKKCIQVQNQVEERRQSDAFRKNLKRCHSCQGMDDVNQQTGLCRNCIKSQQQMMNMMESNKKQQVAGKDDASKQQPPKMVIHQEKMCAGCKTKTFVRAESTLCDHCFQIKSKIGFSQQPKGQEPATQQSSSKKNERYCSKCNNRILPQFQGDLCGHCFTATQSYNSYTCQRCRTMYIKGLVDGLCPKCHNSRVR